MGHDATDPWRPIGSGAWVGTDASSRFPVYTRGNAGEVYPEVFTPLSFSTASASGERAMRNAILATGVIRPDEIADLPLSTAVGSGVFGGYAYLNLSVQRLAAARMPGGSAADADASYMGVGEHAPHVPSELDRNLRASLAGIRWLLRTLRTRELPQLALDQQRVAAYLRSLPDVSAATDRDLADASTSQLEELFMQLFETHLIVSSSAGAMMTVLTSICDKQLGDPSLAVTLVSGIGGIDSAAPSVALWSLARKVEASAALRRRFDDGIVGLDERLRESCGSDPTIDEFVAVFDAFLDEFGSRGPNEWDTAFDTWQTDPALALTLVDRMRAAPDSHDPASQSARLAAERVAAEQEALTRLRWPMRPLFRRVLAATQLYSQSRERTKTTVIRAIHGARLQAQELDRRLVERSGGQRGDLWFLVRDEVDGYVEDPARFADTIATRRAMHARLSERIPPFVFHRELPPLDEWELRGNRLAPVTVGEVITGLAGCPGVARGRARVVLDPADPGDLEPGDVLVAPLTDPSWTPLFVPADAVVVDVGAVMSHAVIVSRELGIPCAVSVQHASRRIPDGTLIEVDGGRGTVTVLALPD